MNRIIYIVPLIALSLSTVAAAQHADDIELSVVNGRITLSASVFGAELGESFPNFANDPGFDSAPGTFPPGSQIGFSVLDALRKWDASDFDAVPAETMSISSGPALVTTPATAGSVVAGFALNVPASGAWHQHLGYTLNDPASDGIYMLKLELFSSDAAIGKSEPFYLVFNQNSDEAMHEAAIAYVESNLVPEPAGLAVIGAGAVGLLHRRRRA